MKTGAMKDQATTGLVPKLRFPEFRAATAWKVRPGNRLFDQVSDKSPEPGLPVLAITQEYGAIPRDLIDYHVSVSEKSIESFKVVQVGDFIISLRSFQGGIEYSQYHGICSPAYVILRRSAAGSNAYFKHYLKTDRFIQILTKNLEGLRDGKMISYKQFSELRIPTPEPEEQQKIADCLGSLDELIAAQGRKVEALKTHKKGLMQQLFPREGESQPRLRFPEFRESKDWDRKRLGDFSDVSASGDLDSSLFSSNKTTQHVYPVYSNAVERDGIYGYYSEARYPRDSVTITARGTLGIAFLRRQEFMGIGRLLVVKDIHGVAPEFLVECWNHLAVIPKEVTSIPQLTAVTARGLSLPIPATMEEQQRIADCLSSLDALITLALQELDAIKTHKQGLMQQLFPSQEALDA